VNNCFFLPQKIYVTPDKYNEREQALMKVSLLQGMESTVEATTTTLLHAELEPDSTKLMGASIDSKMSKLNEESNHCLQTFENKLEESTNKRLKCLEDLITSLASKPSNPSEPTLKPREGTPHGAQQKKSRGMDKQQPPTSNQSWHQGGPASGRGRGRG
jgi:hypothetical protein